MSSECSFCNHRNPPGAKYCNECGSPLNFKPCTECGAVNEGSAPSCYKCGAKLPDQVTGIEDGRDMAPTANVATLATSDRGLAQEREELHRTATAGVSQSPERDVPHAIEGSVGLLAPSSISTCRRTSRPPMRPRKRAQCLSLKGTSGRSFALVG